VPTIHVVDDLAKERKVMKEEITKSWPASPTIRQWCFVWSLVEEEGALEEGDIVISDLYPSRYWTYVPDPKPVREAPLPDDPTNILKAVDDILKRFLPQVTAGNAHLAVVTWVPNWLEHIVGSEDLANHVRTVLSEQPFKLIEKEDKFRDRESYRQASDWARERLQESSA
jgi:hypothetical protein